MLFLPDRGFAAVHGRRLPKDFVDDMPERRRGVDDAAVLRNVFLCLMQSHSKVAFGLLATPLIVRSLLKPLEHGVTVDLKDKDAVKEIDELGKIPRATAEKCHRLLPVRDQGFDSIHIPDMVLVHLAGRRRTSLRIALICQLGVAINGTVAAPPQFSADRRFPAAGHAFN